MPVTDCDDPAANKAVVRRLFEEVIDGGRLDLAPSLLRADYIQHNPSVGQGVAGFVAYFEQLERTKSRLRVQSTLEIRHMLTEHWDVIQGAACWRGWRCLGRGEPSKWH